MPTALLVAGAVCLLLSLNALRPPRLHVVTVLTFFSGWLTGELAQWWLVAQLALAIGLSAAGGLATWRGLVGLALFLMSMGVLTAVLTTAAKAGDVMEAALRRGLGDDYRDHIDPDLLAGREPGLQTRMLLTPLRLRHPSVEITRDITFARAGGRDLRLDVFRHKSRPDKCPALLQVHGGAWVLGHKEKQAQPLMLQLAAHGWVCVNADYRLSPKATFPDHLMDLKHALRWIREEGPAFGVDPDFVVVTGGSAGGHLAALLGLTANDAEYQPGFEHVDTSVRAAVPYYGIYDFVNRDGSRAEKGMTRTLLTWWVMKSKPKEDPEGWAKASPIARVRSDAPPFFVIHGACDTLASPATARRFAARLAEVSSSPVLHAELPGAQHAFEMFPSVRSIHVVNAVERFLDYIYTGYLAARGEQPPLEGAVTKGEGA